MLKDLRIPRMGSVENARLVAWRIAEGEAFAAGQVLYEIETDKTSVEIEADEAGVLAQRLAAPGDEFKVGDRLGLWAQPGTTPGAITLALPSAAAPVAVPDIRPLPRTAAGGRRISPLARRLAALHGVDLGNVVGTGAGGKISGRDVLAAREAIPATPPPPPALSPPPDADAEVVIHSLRRRTIAQRMVQAGAIPSLTADMEVDLTALFAHRKQSGQGASVLGLIAHAATAALLDHPALNAHWREDALVRFRTVHLGVAVDTPEGLVVPVVRHAERLSPLGLTAAIAELAAKAREGRLRPEELEGGSFTLSNPGAIGPVLRAEALLNPPQVALLGLPGIVHIPRAIRDGDGWSIAVRPVIRLSLTFDHRALDGGPVIAFLNTLKSRIEAI